eukprot:1191146-Prorocentrum_minimum.AAC.2
MASARGASSMGPMARPHSSMYASMSPPPSTAACAHPIQRSTIHVSGYPSIVSGYPSVVSGYSSVVSGYPSIGSGYPSIGSGYSSIETRLLPQRRLQLAEQLLLRGGLHLERVQQLRAVHDARAQGTHRLRLRLRGGGDPQPPRRHRHLPPPPRSPSRSRVYTQRENQSQEGRQYE